MDKKDIFKKIIIELERVKQTLTSAALEAKEAATNEESKAENKYDTRGLEASYLAGAQAKRAVELKNNIEKINALELKSFDESEPLDHGALTCVEIDGEEEKWFFILPCEGGVKIESNSKIIYSLTLDSPLGKKLRKKRVGDYFDFKTKNQNREYEITEIF